MDKERDALETQRHLYIFDKDGTLTDTKSGWPPNTLGEQFLLPGVKEKLSKLHSEKHFISVATNQGGVSHGYFSHHDFMRIFEEFRGMLDPIVGRGVDISVSYFAGCYLSRHIEQSRGVDISVSYYHEKGQFKDEFVGEGFMMPKPHPDTLIQCSKMLLEHKLIEKIFFIGNAFTDQEAAKNCNDSGIKCEFVWAHDFFGFEIAEENSHGYRYVTGKEDLFGETR